MDLEMIMPWISAALAIIALLTQAKSFFSSGEKALGENLESLKTQTTGKLEAVSKTLIDHDRRIQTIESEIKHLPDRETTHRMELVMAEINGKMNVMAERLKPIEAIGERLQETLMEQARK